MNTLIVNQQALIIFLSRGVGERGSREVVKIRIINNNWRANYQKSKVIQPGLIT
ncbi:MAG: hypothetical protein F6K23_32095 [Okeania sp. SIO2C9]|uniref:hypothetical protein n=1 Tax=Okeania sp. SIO2C9 TaxID=2607791 RepID=UPI0013BFBBEE|nr:hypothetical protein [Okeania sp. SIO2C9]NEQ77246.1 hypothetical protein [Okeania sp. SIO2C9]